MRLKPVIPDQARAIRRINASKSRAFDLGKRRDCAAGVAAKTDLLPGANNFDPAGIGTDLIAGFWFGRGAGGQSQDQRKGPQRGLRLARIRCSVRRCMFRRRAVSETLRSHSS